MTTHHLLDQFGKIAKETFSGFQKEAKFPFFGLHFLQKYFGS